MPLPPETSPLPPSPIMLQSSIVPPAGPAPTPLPVAPDSKPTQILKFAPKKDPSEKDTFDETDLPMFRLEIRDLKHSGAQAFLTNCIVSTALESAVLKVLELLYISPKAKTTHLPGTRSVTLILRGMQGVAYTTDSELDNDHKEIYLSLDYLAAIKPERRADEIMGVLTHEMVHCYQYNGGGKAPVGLMEGIADWVRLKADLGPPHWKRSGDGKWDAGYERTAWFLEYLEQRFGGGTVGRLNEKLRVEEYREKALWTELMGWPVEQLWGDYGEALEKGELDEPEIKQPSKVGNDDTNQAIMNDREKVQ